MLIMSDNISSICSLYIIPSFCMMSLNLKMASLWISPTNELWHNIFTATSSGITSIWAVTLFFMIVSSCVYNSLTEIRYKLHIFYQTEDIKWLNQKKTWKGLKSIVMEKKTINDLSEFWVIMPAQLWHWTLKSKYYSWTKK